MPETQSQPHPVVEDKRKTLSKMINLRNLPSRQGHKKVKHGLSKSRVSKLGSVVPPASQQPSIQIHYLDSSILAKVTPSKPVVTSSSQPSRRVPMNLLENEDLAWERFQQIVTNKDIVACNDMFLKEFEHSTFLDLFKVCFVILFWSYFSFIRLITFCNLFVYIGHVKVHGSVQAGY